MRNVDERWCGAYCTLRRERKTETRYTYARTDEKATKKKKT